MSLTSDPPRGGPAVPPAAPAAAEPAADEADRLTVVPVRHPWRRLAVAATAVLLLQFAHGLTTNPGWEWEVFAEFFTAMRSILPNAANEIISLFKGTSIVSVMAIGELFHQVQVVYGRNGRVVPLLMVATLWYVPLTTVLSVVQHYVEKRFAKGATP
ncbi:hypothetical protein [Streptomyces sp. NPDC058374]|uniref:hypothetical protein n=1 Tax=unclassified Streptomyces TaxID=2593676 RepID=UPI00365FA9A8